MLGLEYLAETDLCTPRSANGGKPAFAVDRVLSGHPRGAEWGYSYSEIRRAEARPTGTLTESIKSSSIDRQYLTSWMLWISTSRTKFLLGPMSFHFGLFAQATGSRIE